MTGARTFRRRPLGPAGLLMAGWLLGVTVAGCGSGAASPARPGGSAGPVTAIFPVIVSPVLAVGENRVVYSVLDADRSDPAAAPARASTIRAIPVAAGPGQSPVPGPPAEGSFLWAVDGIAGLYRASLTLDRPGAYDLEVTLRGDGVRAPAARARVDVLPARPGLKVGDRAPRTPTPTLATAGGEARRLTTDVAPEASFYRSSIPDLLDAARPFVVLFGSPGFCTNGTCGPAIARFKTAAKASPGVEFLQVESYEVAWQDGRLQPVLDAKGALQPSTTFLAWSLATETTIVVVGRDGRVAAIFDVVVAPGEVEAAVRALG